MERAHLVLAMMARRSTIWWVSWSLVMAAALPLFAAPPLDPARPFDFAQGRPLDSARPAAGRDTVVIGVAAEPNVLNPILGTTGPSLEIMNTTRTRDVQQDPNWKIFPVGVEYLPSLADGTWQVDGERMRLLWKLRPRNWHDGKPVTCADYVFTLKMVYDERVPVDAGGRAFVMRRVANVSCPAGASGLTVAVTWKERWPFAHISLFLVPFVLPRHVLEPFYRANPASLDRIPYGHDPQATIGDGAYRLVEWKKNESLTVEAVANHPIFGTPKIRRIQWRFVPREALGRRFMAGDIDVISTVAGIPFDEAVQLQRQAAGRFRVIFEPAPIWEHIGFNLDNPLLADLRVRRAIAHGINRTQLVQQLFAGRQPVSHTYLTPKQPGYTDEVQRYPYDPAKARVLLRQAGFAPGPDGVMVSGTGQRLSLELNTTSGVPFREQVQRAIQEQLRQIGIEVAILNFPGRVLLGEIIGRRRFKAMVMITFLWSLFDTCDGIYTSDGIPNEANGWVGQNYSGYESAEMDSVCKAIARELDETRRNQLIRQSARIFARDLPALPLYYRVFVGAVKLGLKNFTAQGGDRTYETWNAHTWYWE